MDKNKANVPKIRFPGFTDPWEQRKLGELCDVYDGTHQTPNYQSSGIMFLSVENINSLKSEKYISKEDFIKNFNIFPEKGDILMTRIGDIGTANVVESNEPKAYYVSLALLKKKSLDPYFLKESISSETLKNDLWKRTLHIAFPKKINKNEIAEVLVPYPGKREEQEQIGVFFKKLDNLITLHQRKLNHLQDKKKGLLQKMFPKSGEKFPELRFPGYTDSWKQCKLLEQVERVLDYRGKSPTKFGMSWGNSGYLVLSALNVKNGYIDKSVEAKFGNQELFDRWMGNERLEKGDVLFTTEAPLGNIAQVPDNDGYILNQRAVAFKTSPDKLDNNFLATLLSSPLFQSKLQANSSGGTAKGIGMKEFAKITTMLPIDITEQKKIGLFFKNLDYLITIHQRKLNHLQEQKKALLQQMFV